MSATKYLPVLTALSWAAGCLREDATVVVVDSVVELAAQNGVSGTLELWGNNGTFDADDGYAPAISARRLTLPAGDDVVLRFYDLPSCDAPATEAAAVTEPAPLGQRGDQVGFVVVWTDARGRHDVVADPGYLYFSKRVIFEPPDPQAPDPPDPIIPEPIKSARGFVAAIEQPTGRVGTPGPRVACGVVRAAR
jgi:hypothetical protein